MAGQQKVKTIGFKTVQLLKDQVLGIGSYGKVCKAECDGLLCAAKVMHETLFDPTTQQLIAPCREHRLPMRRFEQFGVRTARPLSLSKVWRSVTNIPAIDSSYVSLRGRLLAIGGKHSNGKPITAVHMYDPSTNSWEVISHMATLRSKCYVAVLPDNQLIVVGGFTDIGGTKTDSVEIATSHFE